MPRSGRHTPPSGWGSIGAPENGDWFGDLARLLVDKLSVLAARAVLWRTVRRDY
ncbi:MAG: hypothetical protein HYV63_01795 [Candidatus Schekmanbacteria bacterium]|nr:hypothetical protein [Candidatus Schekmanbacteria bacterium]